jgi:molecular chaperone DnaK (HSP70)
MTKSRYVVGIDLGTTNIALAYVDTSAGPIEDARPQPFTIPQVVGQNDIGDRPLLPSFLYLPGPNELPAGSLKLPWDTHRDYAVGEFARIFGSQVPTRLVSSAKSWLCHPGVDRRSPFLPWKAQAGARQVSPLDVTIRYMKHLVEAWNHTIGKDVAANRLENQDVILTVPASFDAAARDLTVEAAKAAGFDHLTLLEEPQAAFYAWLDAHRADWRERVHLGDLILVADVGGGTTDLTLIEVSDDAGKLVLTRVAVGDHLLLGGDNMDLALAHAAGKAIGGKLDLGQTLQLGHSCRLAKETLFADANLASAPVTVLGRGRGVIGGTLRTELNRVDVEKLLVDGFFPHVPIDAEPLGSRSAGLTELGLPYASDPAITKHLAFFLRRQAEALAQRETPSKRTLPNAVLFNGGVFKATPLQKRLLSVLNEWAAADARKPKKGEPKGVRALEGTDLDLAVARGAAYYGLVRRGKGVRIRGGTARAYYVGIETAMPAVPGASPPLKAFCVAPFGMEEGTEVDLPEQEFGLVIGEPVQFRFLGSTLRRQDAPGIMVEEWEEQIEELEPVAVTLEAAKGMGRTVPVHLHSKVTEVGLLELTCVSRDGKNRWKLAYNVREK